ncbi:MAG: Crp/Fnr family transcriptional regulator [Clostridia bacterium]|nr:Crp/Fnr family transcriptional regulator [Clostridia bacterium]
MKAEHLDFVSNLFPFRNLKERTINAIFEEINYSISTFDKGEVIFSPSCFQKKIGFVINGECAVERVRDGDDAIYLNTLTKCSSFGILSVLSPDSEYPTRIRAIKNASVLFIPAEDFLAVIKKYPSVSMNVIGFLSSRIGFLNKKIATFSEKSTLKKLASYLLLEYGEKGARISVSRTKLSSEIGVGRASLYRDLDFLIDKKIIEVKQKEIIIICPEGLERI